MGLADTTTKDYMKDNKIFADAFNYLLYDGVQVIKPENLQELDTTEIVLPEDDYVQKYRDVLKSAIVKYDDDVSYMILGIENQTKTHYAMPARNLLYDALRYNSQLAAIAAKHRKEKGGGHSPNEFISGFYKDDKLLPVITLVIHFDDDAWDGPLSLHEMLDIKDKSLLRFIPDYKINLIDPARLMESDLDKFSTNLSKLLGCIKYLSDEEQLQKFLCKDGRLIVDPKTARAIKDITSIKIEISDGEEEIDVCKAVEDMLKHSEDKGKAEGLAEGKMEAFIELVNDGVLSVKEAALRANVPESIIREKLNAASNTKNASTMHLF